MLYVDSLPDFISAFNQVPQCCTDDAYLNLLSASNTTPSTDKMVELRKLVLRQGLPETAQEPMEVFGGLTLRSVVWKLLLGSLYMDVDRYISLVKAGPTDLDAKIRDDTFRTYRGDADFWSVVSEATLARVLNAYVRKCSEAKSAVDNTYVQGMNVILAPFLYVMPSELDAFTAFDTLITRHSPQYSTAGLDGQHHACSLVDRLLLILDPELHQHIHGHIRDTEIFAFQFLATLLACMRPLQEVLIVWDAILAFGTHFNVILFCVHLVLHREDLLAADTAYKVQQKISQQTISGRLLVHCGLAAIAYIPGDLMTEIISHPVEKGTVRRTVSDRSKRERSLSPSSRRTPSSGAAKISLPKRPLSANRGKYSALNSSGGLRGLSPQHSKSRRTPSSSPLPWR